MLMAQSHIHGRAPQKRYGLDVTRTSTSGYGYNTESYVSVRVATNDAGLFP